MSNKQGQESKESARGKTKPVPPRPLAPPPQPPKKTNS
jgi:hypothetical protein